MSKYDVGDEFRIKIVGKDHDGNYYTFDNGWSLFESAVNELIPYHEPTLQDHAKVLQENCEKIKDLECKDCEFRKNNLCSIGAEIPQYWDLPSLDMTNEDFTDEEKALLKTYFAMDAHNTEIEYINNGQSKFEVICFRNDDGVLMGTIDPISFPNIYKVVRKRYKR